MKTRITLRRAGPGPGAALLLVVLPLWLCLGPGTACAQNDPAPEEDAQAAFDRAAKLSQEHRYAEALKELEGAAAMDPTPPILLNLGRLREETGDPEGAMRAYRELLTRNRRSRLRAEAETRLHALEERQKTTPRPEVQAPETPLPPVPVTPQCLTCPPPPPCPAPRPAVKPLHRQWWFWVAAAGGAVVIAGAAVGVTLALSQKGPPPAPNTDLGNMRFFFP